MDSLSLSISATTTLSPHLHLHVLPITSPSSLQPRLSLSPKPTSLRLTPSSAAQHIHAPPPTSSFNLDFDDGGAFSPFASSPQTAASAMRAAEADVMGLLLRERIVYLGNSIDDFVADAIIGQLLLLDSVDPTKDIRLLINSSGGSMSATMAIFDVVQLIRADVSTVAIGVAASTASIILGGGTKGKRLAMPNARIMFHQPFGGTGGEVLDVEIQARELMQNKNNIIRIVSEFTGRPREQVEKDMDRDRYMSPIEAVEYGIIDGVIDRDSIIPVEPVPEKVNSTLDEVIDQDWEKFVNPEVPDDEIY